MTNPNRLGDLQSLSPEASAEQQRLQLEAVCNNATVALFVMNRNQHCIYMNPAAELLTGYSRAELQGRSLHETIHHCHPDGSPYPQDECPLVQALHLNTRIQDEDMFVHQDGSFYPVAYAASPLIQDGIAQGTVIEVRNIQAEKQAQIELERFFTIPLDLLCIATLDGYFKRINPAFTHTLGWSEAELLNRPFLEFVHPDDVQATLAEIAHLATGAKTLHFVNRYRCSDGSYRWLDWTAAPFVEENLLYCITHDVTVKRQQQLILELLSDLNEQILHLKDPNEVIAVTVRMLGQHLGVNRCSYSIVDPTQHNVYITNSYAQDIPSLSGKFALEDFGPELLKALLNGQAFVSDNIEKDLQAPEHIAAFLELDIKASIVVPLLRQNRLLAVISVHQNEPRHWTDTETETMRLVINRCWETVERVRQAQELAESEAKFRFMAESLHQKLFTADATGHVDYFNQSWSDYTGLSMNELIGFGWTRMIHPEDLPENLERWTTAVTTGQDYEIEHRFLHTDGHYRWHLTRANAMRNTDGQIMLWLGTSTDIEDLKQAQVENALLLDVAQNSNRLKDEFLSTLSHELRTPLNAILGWAAMLSEEVVDADEISHGLGVIERSARTQARLIEDLLDMARITSGKLRLELHELQLQNVIEAAVETLRPTASARGVNLELMLETTGTVSGDSARLQQVFWNLLSNAIKFTPRHGRVTVHMSQRDDSLIVSVSDTGEGIDPAFLPYVFERFRQADGTYSRVHGGLGLGLTIVRQLVELHGGEATITSPGLNLGTTVRVCLPLVNVPESMAPEALAPGYLSDPHIPSNAENVLANLRILVVADEAKIRSELKTLLMQCGAEVEALSNTYQALQQLTSQAPDLLVSEIDLPGADGYELIQQLRALPAAQGSRIPALALTAQDQSEDRIRILSSGYDMSTSKLVEPAELVAILVSLARRSPA